MKRSTARDRTKENIHTAKTTSQASSLSSELQMVTVNPGRILDRMPSWTTGPTSGGRPRGTFSSCCSTGEPGRAGGAQGEGPASSPASESESAQWPLNHPLWSRQTKVLLLHFESYTFKQAPCEHYMGTSGLSFLLACHAFLDFSRSIA